QRRAQRLLRAVRGRLETLHAYGGLPAMTIPALHPEPFARGLRARLASACLALLCAVLQAGFARAANITSIASSNWRSTSTWSTNQLPTSADNVTIANGHTVTLNTASPTCASLTIGQKISGVLQYLASTASTLTVGRSVTIAADGTLQTAASGNVTTNVL